jgi:hypothetical protein
LSFLPAMSLSNGECRNPFFQLHSVSHSQTYPTLLSQSFISKNSVTSVFSFSSVAKITFYSADLSRRSFSEDGRLNQFVFHSCPLVVQICLYLLKQHAEGGSAILIFKIVSNLPSQARSRQGSPLHDCKTLSPRA